MRAETRMVALVAAGLASTLGAGCGGSDSDDGSLPPGFYITIQSMSFSPLQLAVPPGATVTVLNRDGETHTVTSEATAGAFTPGSVAGVSFDTGLFTGTRAFTISSGAAAGTVIPYYCRNHGNTMATPTGTIRIDASAQPAPAPGGGGGGGGGYLYDGDPP